MGRQESHGMMETLHGEDEESEDESADEDEQSEREVE
jgi:hypothetical protein